MDFTPALLLRTNFALQRSDLSFSRKATSTGKPRTHDYHPRQPCASHLFLRMNMENGHSERGKEEGEELPVDSFDALSLDSQGYVRSMTCKHSKHASAALLARAT